MEDSFRFILVRLAQCTDAKKSNEEALSSADLETVKKEGQHSLEQPAIREPRH